MKKAVVCVLQTLLSSKVGVVETGERGEVRALSLRALSAPSGGR